MMGSRSQIEIAKQGRAALSKWRQANPDVLLNLSEADLVGVNLRGANLKRADLTGACFQEADLVGAQLTEADLTRADLRGAKLVKADFYSAKLLRATLAGADASGAYFRRAEMTQCDLRGTDLTKADLIDANLQKVALQEAILIAAELARTRLTDADLTGATFGWTSLGDLDLSRTLGLDDIKHIGPSMLGIDTATRSHGVLSTTFLQGCGIAEGVINHWQSLFGHPAEQVGCIIRYTAEDAVFAQALFKQAQSKGVRCWLDQQSDEGEKHAHLSSATYETTERVLLCASKPALKTEWMNAELERVLDREQDLKASTGRDIRLLFPLNLDGYMFSGDWKHKHEKYIAKLAIDFVGWRRNTEKLEQEFAKLLPLLIGDKR